MLRSATIVALGVAIAFSAVILVLLLVGMVVRLATGDATTVGEALSIPALALVVTLFYFIIFWVITTIACLAYNLARWLGGSRVNWTRYGREACTGSGALGSCARPRSSE